MVSLFLVEDERIPRESIKQNVHWKENDILFLGDASDGEVALPQILEKRPDILLTDIKMPFMDGLELSQIVREKLPDTKIIVLSGYNEFDYARQAISLGISEYLLKPVSADDILCAVKKVRTEIERSQAQEMTQLDNKYTQREIFFSAVFSGFLENTRQILKRAEQLGINMSAVSYQVIILHLAPPASQVSPDDMPLLKTPEDILASGYNGEQIVYLIRADSDAILAEKAEKLTAWCQKTANQLGITIHLSPGKVVTHLTDLMHSYKSAVHPRNLSDAGKSVHGLSGNPAPFENDTLLEFLRTGKLSMTRHFWDNYRTAIAGGFASLIYRCYLYTELFFVIRRFCEEISIKLPDALFETNLPEKRIENDSSADSFLDFGCELCMQVMSKRDASGAGRYTPAADLAREYIDQHYSDADLSLGAVAEAVSISPNHLSTVFKEKIGVGFTEYLTDVRLRQAKQLLLTTDMRAADIAARIGYQNFNYFSMLFKRVVGVSPSQYRRIKP